MTSNTGVVYSQAVFTFDRVLSPEEYAPIKPFSEQVKAYASRIGFDADAAIDDDVIVDPDTGEIIEPLGGKSDV
jgi:hypothetical protein